MERSSHPEYLFHAVAALVPRLIEMAEFCGLEPIDLLTLWHIRHFGKVNGANRNVILRQELTRILTTKFRVSESQITKMLDFLEQEHLVERPKLDRAERLALFGSAKGQRDVVILTQLGSDKIDEFKEIISTRAKKWISKSSKTVQVAMKIFRPAAEKFAKEFVDRHAPDHTDMLPGSTPNELDEANDDDGDTKH